MCVHTFKAGYTQSSLVLTLAITAQLMIVNNTLTTEASKVTSVAYERDSPNNIMISILTCIYDEARQLAKKKKIITVDKN